MEKTLKQITTKLWYSTIGKWFWLALDLIFKALPTIIGIVVILILISFII